MALIPALRPTATSTNFPSVNSFTLIGYTMPGKWILQDATKKFGWQIQQGYALSGAVVYPKGDELIVAKFKGQIWNNTDMATFIDIRKRLLTKPTFSKGAAIGDQAFGIDHPELKAMGVTAVVVAEITPLKDAGGGLWECTVDLLQYRPPIPAPTPPKQIIPDAQRNPVTTAIVGSEVALGLKSVELAALQASAKANGG